MFKMIVCTILALSVLMGCRIASSQDGKKYGVVDKPQHHVEGGYQNHPFVETAAPKGFLFYMRRFWGSVFTPDSPEGHAFSPEKSLNLLNSVKGDQISWLGHATFLIKLSGTTILTDPFLSEFASPVSWAGPRRYVDPGISIENLPQIDIVLISHSHYDHLDEETIEKLGDKDNIHVLVPLGLKPFFIERGYKNVTELDWHEPMTIEGIEVTSLPSVHDSARSISDHNKTLWASWGIEGGERKILFIGDTGYSKEIFRDIGNQYGPFDYSILPIGAYEPRELMWMSHVTPEEAVTIGIETNTKILVASHWGTVSSLSDEPPFEPPVRFREAGIENGFSDNELWVLKVGETRAMAQKEGVKYHIDISAIQRSP
ncbi:MAG TPA: hydrolase [Gammaproteobacteria bacterium]|nr:hydrolase [Gammaproteobacteria bacterium]